MLHLVCNKACIRRFTVARNDGLIFQTETKLHADCVVGLCMMFNFKRMNVFDNEGGLELPGVVSSRLATAMSPLTCRLSVILSSPLHPVHRSTVLMFAVQCLPLVSAKCLLSSRRCLAFPPVLLHSLVVNSDAAPPKRTYLPCTYH